MCIHQPSALPLAKRSVTGTLALSLLSGTCALSTRRDELVRRKKLDVGALRRKPRLRADPFAAYPSHADRLFPLPQAGPAASCHKPCGALGAGEFDTTLIQLLGDPGREAGP